LASGSLQKKSVAQYFFSGLLEFLICLRSQQQSIPHGSENKKPGLTRLNAQNIGSFWKLFDKKRAATMQLYDQLWTSLAHKPGSTIFMGEVQIHFTSALFMVPFTEKQRLPTFRKLLRERGTIPLAANHRGTSMIAPLNLSFIGLREELLSAGPLSNFDLSKLATHRKNFCGKIIVMISWQFV